MAQKSIKRNYIFNLCYQLLLILTPLITTPYISRVMSADGIGTVSYVESIVSYFNLFAAMGIATYGQREISYAQDSLEKRSIAFWNTKLLNFGTSSIALAAYILFSLTQQDPRLYLVFTVNLLSVMMDITWFFSGLEEFGKVVLRNIVLKVMNIIYVFLMVRSQEDIYRYALGHVLFGFLGNISLWAYLPRYIQRVSYKELHPFRDLKIVLSLFLPTIAIQIYTVLDKTMIGAITQNAFESGYYEQAMKISKMLMAVIGALGTVMAPRVGYHFKRQELETVKQLIRSSFRFVFALAIPLCLGLIFTSENFVPWFFGPGYEKVASLLKVLALLIPIIGISNVTGVQYMVPTGRQRGLTISVVAGACINFIMNLFLINAVGARGAAIASVIAEVTVTLVQLYLVRKELPLRQIFRDSQNYVLASGVMVAWLTVLNQFLASSVLSTLVMVVSGAAVYFIALILLRDTFLMSNLENAISKRRKPSH